MKILYSFIFVSLANILSAQTYNWSFSNGSSTYDYVDGFDVNSVGETYSLGAFSTSFDADPGIGTFNITPNGGSDLFILKTTNNGAFSWCLTIGGTGIENASDLKLDPFGNIIILGLYKNTVDFNPGSGVANMTSTGTVCGFILKLDPNGNYLWSKTFDGTSGTMSYPQSIGFDTDGNLYVSGFFEGTVDFNLGTGVSNSTSVSANDAFTLKLDNQGNYIWHNTYGQGNNTIPIQVVVQNNTIYTVGSYSGTSDFDPGVSVTSLSSNGDTDGYIQKMDTSGTFIWAKSYGSFSGDGINSVCIDGDANIYFTGYFLASVDFDYGPGTAIISSATNGRLFIVKLNPTGDFVWANTYGAGSSSISASTIQVDDYGNLLSAGQFNSSANLNTNGSSIYNSLGNTDGYVQRLDTAGHFIWAQPLGGTQNEYLGGLHFTNNGDLYFNGSTDGNLNLDPFNSTAPYTSTGSADFFIAKWAICTVHSTSTINIAACDNYISPSGNYTWTSSGIYQDTINNVFGCDSIITVNLTVSALPITSVSQNGAIFSAAMVGASYQWLDCDNGYQPLSGQINQSFTATVNGNYAVAITSGSCPTDTSACLSISNVGLIETNGHHIFNIFPNPVLDILNIQSLEAFELIIIDLSGNVVRTQHIDIGNNQINLDALSSGAYIIYLKNDHFFELENLIKIK